MTQAFEPEEIEAPEIVVSEFARTRVQGDPPLHCFPMRIDWELAKAKARERSQHPEPQVTSLEKVPIDFVMPAPVLALAEHARAAGWAVRVTYARGHGVHGSTGRPTALQHVIAVRFGGQAVATYARAVSGGAWTWRSIWIWGPDLPHFGLCNLAELKAWLVSRVLDVPAVRERVRIEAEAKALQEAARAELKVVLDEVRGRRPATSRELAMAILCTELGLELEREEVERVLKPAKAKRESGN